MRLDPRNGLATCAMLLLVTLANFRMSSTTTTTATSTTLNARLQADPRQVTSATTSSGYGWGPQEPRQAEGQQLIELLEINYLAKTRGFSIESHKIVTRDSYILTLHRLVNPLIGRHELAGTVILQHGILCASPFFLMNSSPTDDRPTRRPQPEPSGRLSAEGPNKGQQHMTTSPATSNSLAIALANSGYDVWLANFRGTQYSRDYLTANSSQRMRTTTATSGSSSSITNEINYWSFNVDTLIEFDLEAYVNYILWQTNGQSYVFVGHSLGATVGLGSLLVHQNTQVTKKLTCSMLMAPVASTQYMQGSLLPLFQLATLLYGDLAPFPGANESFAPFVRHLCLFAQRACTWLAGMFIGAKQAAGGKLARSQRRRPRPPWAPATSSRRPARVALQILRRILDLESLDGRQFGGGGGSSNLQAEADTETSGDDAHTNEALDKLEYQNQVNTFVLMMHQSISIQILKHIVQVHVSGRLSRFNYGPELNMRKYGRPLAPVYDLHKVDEPHLKLAILSGPSDAISTPQEIQWISDQIWDRVGHYEHIQVPVDPFNHMDLVMSRDSGELVNKRVLEFIERNNCFP